MSVVFVSYPSLSACSCSCCKVQSTISNNLNKFGVGRDSFSSILLLLTE